jgi:hypothetical protein
MGGWKGSQEEGIFCKKDVYFLLPLVDGKGLKTKQNIPYTDSSPLADGWTVKRGE